MLSMFICHNLVFIFYLFKTVLFLNVKVLFLFKNTMLAAELYFDTKNLKTSYIKCVKSRNSQKTLKIL